MKMDMVVEHHVYTCHIFEKRVNDGTKFGGDLSVRRKKSSKRSHSSCLDMMSASSNNIQWHTNIGERIGVWSANK
jgi:hypothetical protein